MKNIHLYSALLCLTTLYTGIATARTIEAVGVPAVVSCPLPTATVTVVQPRVFHSDKIVFRIVPATTGAGLVPAAGATAATQEELKLLPFNTPLDIKVNDNPGQVADIKRKVLSFLGASVDPQSGNAAKIVIESVSYSAVVCPKLP